MTPNRTFERTACQRGWRVPSRLGGELACGLLVSTADTDYILHAAGITPMHGDHIAAHELCHLMLGHVGQHNDAAGAEMVAARLLPDVHPTAIRRLLGRTIYADQQENEAETFASIFMAECSRPTAMLRAGADTDSRRDQLQWLFDTTPRRYWR